jgi:hypothetical protein
MFQLFPSVGVAIGTLQGDIHDFVSENLESFVNTGKNCNTAKP